MASTNVGVGYLAIVPSTKGFAAKLSSETEDAAGKAGDKSAKKMAGSFKSTMSKAAKVAGAAVGAALVASVIEGAKREQGSDKLAASLGLSPEESKRIASVSADIYKGAWGESTEEVNAALKSVIQQIGGMADATDEELMKVTTSVLDLATAFDQDLGATAAAVGQLMKTGMAKDATEAMDILTKGFQNGTDKSGDLLDTMTEYGTQFRAIGVDGPSALGLLSQGLQAGARDADTVADALKEFAIRAVDGSSSSALAFQNLGMNAEKMRAQIAAGGEGAAQGLDQVLAGLRQIEDPALRAETAVGLFGTKAEDMGEALFSLNLGTAAEGLGEFEGAAAAMGDTLNDNSMVAIEGYKRQIQDMGLKAVEALGPVGALGAALLSFAPAVLGTIGPLISAAAARSAATAATIAATTAENANTVAQGRSKVAMIAGAVAMGVVKVATIAWTAVQWALNVALTANPIGIVIVAIAALIAGIIWAWNNVDWFRDAVMVAWEFIKTAFQVAIDFIVGYVKVYFAIIKKVIEVVFNALKIYFTVMFNIYKKIFEVGLAAVMWVWDNVFMRIHEVVVVTFGLVRGVIENVVGWIQTAFEFISNIVDKIMGVIGPIKDFVGGALGAITGGAIEFHHGGVVPGAGEVPATLLGGEGVVNREGMRNLGAQGLSDLNNGRSGGGGGGFTVESLTINNPKAEPAGLSLGRSVRKVAYQGQGF